MVQTICIDSQAAKKQKLKPVRVDSPPVRFIIYKTTLRANIWTLQDLIKKADIPKIAQEGGKIYQKIKVNYEPKENGKFLAIDI